MPTVDELVREGLPVVAHLARQLVQSLRLPLPLEDLESAGREALVLAARSFDPSLGVPFRRYANLRVRGGILDAVRANGSLPRSVYQKLRALEAIDGVERGFSEHRETPEPKSVEDADREITSFLAQATTAAALGMLQMRGLDAAAEVADDADDAFERVARRELAELVRKVVAEQPEQERHILTRHYFDGVALDEASREIGLSKSWGSRLHARGLESVARSLKRAKFHAT